MASIQSTGSKFYCRKLELPGQELSTSIPLVKILEGVSNNQQVFHFDEKAIKLLESLKKPVGVLAICGSYRSGKSSLLSLMVAKAGGEKQVFETSDGMNPFTKGIWLSTTVLESEEMILLLVDTEGTNAVVPKKESKIVNPLIGLTILISSQLICNLEKSVKQTDLTHVSTFAAIGRCILKENQQEKNAMHRHYPQLIWLVRDFQFKLPEGETVEEKLEKMILESKGEAGHELKGIFPEMCFKTLPHPGVTEYEELKSSSKFMQKFSELNDQILQGAKPKQGYRPDISVDGPLLIDMIRNYVQAINEGKYPNLDNSWGACMQHRLDSLASDMSNDFLKEMQSETEKKLPMEVGLPVILKDGVSPSDMNAEYDATLMGHYTRIFEPMYTSYLKEVDVLLPELEDAKRKQQIHKLQSLVATFEYTEQKLAISVTGGSLHVFIDRNFIESEKKCDQIVSELSSELKNKVMSNVMYTVDQFQHDTEETVKKFNQLSIGPAKQQGLTKLYSLIETLDVAVKISERNQQQIQHLQSEMERKNEKINEMELRQKSLAEDIMNIEEREKAVRKMLEEVRENEAERRAELESEIEALSQQKEEEERRQREIQDSLFHVKSEVVSVRSHLEESKRENEREKRERQEEEERNRFPGEVEELRVLDVTDDSVTLSWYPPSNADQTQSWYQVEVKRNNQTWHERSRDNNKTISYLQMKTPYEIRVRAVSQKNVLGDYSKPLKVITKDLTPTVPANLRVIGRDNNRIKIRWDRHSDNDKTAKAVEGYFVHYKKSGSDEAHKELYIPADKYEALVEELESNSEYLIKVGATNSSGICSFSDHIIATTKVGNFVRGMMMAAVALPTLGLGSRALYKNRTTGDLGKKE